MALPVSSLTTSMPRSWRRASVSAPMREVSRWQEAPRAAGEPMVDAMALARASPDARPSARMVLLRGLDDRGLVFFTDYGSDKSRDLDANPRAALLLHWLLPRH